MTEKKGFADFNGALADCIGRGMNVIVEDFLGYLQNGFAAGKTGNTTWMPHLYAFMFEGMGYGTMSTPAAMQRRNCKPDWLFVWNDKAKEMYERMTQEGIFSERTLEGRM